MAGVKFEHIYKIYDNGFQAVKDFHFTIQDGEFLVLVGPSGCGKTTTLRMLAGLEEISRGDLCIGERRVNDIPPRDRDIAMVFQDYALYPHFSVRENLAFSLKLRGMSRQEIAGKVNDAAEILELKHLLERKPKQLSGGQRQRVAIGRAIVRKPQVFLFDEPLSNLDAKLRAEMRVELAKLHKKLSTTIVYVTHDQMEAMTLADRIVVMKEGVIQQAGAPMDIYERPANSFVASFIGTPPMNQVAATLRTADNRMVIVGQEFTLPVPPEMASQLTAHTGQEILVGIRPQHMTLYKDAASSFKAKVDVIEPMGSESFVYFTLEHKQWVVRHDGLPPVAEGEIADVVVDMPKVHLFSKDGSQRLC